MTYISRTTTVCLVLCFALILTPAAYSASTELQVYKGELRFHVPGRQAADSLQIQYRSKVREVMRIGVNGLTLTNMRTNKVLSLRNQSANLANHIDGEGYWITDILYNEVDLGDDEYRIEGRLTLDLIGSQRTRNFSIYLKPAKSRKPRNSSIDWGASD